MTTAEYTHSKRIIEENAQRQLSDLKSTFQKTCEHKNIFRNSFFVSTTAHEWDECRDCGKHFNEISFPA